ncbi:hypothetical protein [Nevskia soli]|uniref:hypothetical protein n=1 Tax=Nevskia soli TaxID=418856 RepID=UPI0004A71387|nr:hypothetical protein [Nevskia soli]
MPYRATKSRILFGWCVVLGFMGIVPFLSYRTAMALVPLCALVGRMCLGPTQGKPLGELVEEDPQRWRTVALIWLVVAALAVYTALFHRTVITFLMASPLGWLIFFAAILGPFIPSIYQHERERYRNAPRY